MSIGNKIYRAAMSLDAFELEVMKITGNPIEQLDMSDDRLFWRIAVVQEALNQLIMVAEDRQLLAWNDGMPVVPSAAPDGVDLTEVAPRHFTGPAMPNE